MTKRQPRRGCADLPSAVPTPLGLNIAGVRYARGSGIRGLCLDLWGNDGFRVGRGATFGVLCQTFQFPQILAV